MHNTLHLVRCQLKLLAKTKTLLVLILLPILFAVGVLGALLSSIAVYFVVALAVLTVFRSDIGTLQVQHGLPVSTSEKLIAKMLVIVLFWLYSLLLAWVSQIGWSSSSENLFSLNIWTSGLFLLGLMLVQIRNQIRLYGEFRSGVLYKLLRGIAWVIIATASVLALFENSLFIIVILAFVVNLLRLPKEHRGRMLSNVLYPLLAFVLSIGSFVSLSYIVDFVFKVRVPEWLALCVALAVLFVAVTLLGKFQDIRRSKIGNK
ncbi:MAG: hypothetical protein ACRC5C_05710 [Bacilli bacterium]